MEFREKMEKIKILLPRRMDGSRSRGPQRSREKDEVRRRIERKGYNWKQIAEEGWWKARGRNGKVNTLPT